jgi:hypothetical protein
MAEPGGDDRMTDEQDRGLEEAPVGTPSHPPSTEDAADGSVDYRDELRSRRWDAAPLANPEVEKTDPRIALAFIVVLLALTFVVIVVGYTIDLWP